MEEQKDFLILRYSLVRATQSSLLEQKLPEQKGLAIIDAIINDREFKHNGVNYSFVGFVVVSPIPGYDFPEKRFFVGKIAKLRRTHMGEKIPGDIIEWEKDDWIPLLTIVDTVDQYIIVSRDWRFGTPEQIAGAFQFGLTKHTLSIYNHNVFVEGVTKKDAFWNIIKDHTKFYRLHLRLVSPNILETNIKAREALGALQDLFGQEEVDIELRNDAGALAIPQNMVEDYIDYIENGEGSWKITTEGEKGGKKTHSSLENTKTVQLQVPKQDEVEEQRQVEIDTGKPAIARKFTDARMVAELYATISKIDSH